MAKTTAKKETKAPVKPAAPAKPEVKKTETAAKAAQTVKEEAKTTATAAKETKPAAKPAKAPAKKTAVKKKADPVQEVFVEYGGDQILTEDIVNRIKETYVNEGHYASSIKSLRVYVNLEERKAYYVINDKAEDRFVEF